MINVNSNFHLNFSVLQTCSTAIENCFSAWNRYQNRAEDDWSWFGNVFWTQLIEWNHFRAIRVIARWITFHSQSNSSIWFLLFGSYETLFLLLFARERKYKILNKALFIKQIMICNKFTFNMNEKEEKNLTIKQLFFKFCCVCNK